MRRSSSLPTAACHGTGWSTRSGLRCSHRPFAIATLASRANAGRSTHRPFLASRAPLTRVADLHRCAANCVAFLQHESNLSPHSFPQVSLPERFLTPRGRDSAFRHASCRSDLVRALRAAAGPVLFLPARLLVVPATYGKPSRRRRGQPSRSVARRETPPPSVVRRVVAPPQSGNPIRASDPRNCVAAAWCRDLVVPTRWTGCRLAHEPPRGRLGADFARLGTFKCVDLAEDFAGESAPIGRGGRTGHAIYPGIGLLRRGQSNRVGRTIRPPSGRPEPVNDAAIRLTPSACRNHRLRCELEHALPRRWVRCLRLCCRTSCRRAFSCTDRAEVRH